MYIPVDKETSLHLATGEGNPAKRPVVAVSANREKTLIAAIAGDAVYIWLSNPHLLLCTLSLTENDLREKGEFRKVYWRYDSSCIAVCTSLNHIMIYRVDISDENCYNLTDSHNSQRSSQELFLRGSRPSVALYPAVIVNLAATPTCCVPLREELLVCVKNGFCHHITWEGAVRTDYSIRLASVPFAHDQLQSKREFINDAGVHIVDAVYAPLTGGYCIVLSDGRAALLTSSDTRFHPNSLLGVWVHSLKDAVCTDVNHKFRLLTFGCKNGDLVGFHLDDTNGSLMQTFRVALAVKDGPEISNRIGPCIRMSVLPNGSALAAVWSTEAKPDGEDLSSALPPVAAIFSPFGAQLWCSLEGVSECDAPASLSYTTVEWGTEGYHLWMGRTDGLSVLPLTRLAASCNPVMEQHDRVVLISGTKVLVSPPREREAKASAPHAVWTTVNFPNEYISVNWPIRFACLDSESSRTLVVAGVRGLAHCNLATGRWKIFGNESQERDLIVTGGIFLWNGTVGVACCENDSGKEALKFYPLGTKLDNRFASVTEADARMLMISTREDALVTFDVESRILLYKMERTDDPNAADSYPKVSLQRMAEIRVSDLIPHPACLVSLQLTQLNLDAGGGSFIPGVDTVLVNVSGKLITLSPKIASKDDEERFQLNQPIMVASFVEQMWHDRTKSPTSTIEDSAHLSNALWFNCGSKGMKVWLPLLPGKRSHTTQQEASFISKRIMLPYELGIYPVVICASDCLAIGVEAVRMQLSLHGGKQLAYHNLHRNSEVFVHHLLRQLLKRNLGMFALEVAAICRPLPYFSHSLELLLHGVLEEEATSSEPIPDPLLPRCVAFIREFPEFLKTVAHCARKTELALWPALFAVTGSPNELFEVCLRDGQLQTAASYLIVLQSIEHSQISQEQSLHLLREALAAGEWKIARDMVRFARSIDAEDMDSPARSPVPPQQSRRTASMSLNNGEANELVFSRFQAAAKVSKVRHSYDHKEGQRKDSTGSTKKVSRAMSNDTGPPSPTTVSNPMAEKMDSVLVEHGQRLLDEYCIRDLGSFCAHLCVDHRKIASRHAVADFPVALTRLHSQFSWPYPVPGKHVVDHLEKRFGAMRTSRSNVSLAGSGSLETVKATPSRLSSVVESEKSEKSPTVQPPSEGTTDSCSIEEAKLVPVTTERNGRASPESATTPMAVDTPDTRSTNGDWQGVEVLVGEATSKGPCTSQLQLATMLHLFSEACAIDWVFLLCLVSRDVTTLREEINASSIAKWGVKAFGQTRLGCLSLLNWATANCLGYVSVLQVFNAHLEMVSEQAGLLNLPPVQNGRTTARKDLKVITPPYRSIRSPQLRETFRGRERSRSVDRLAPEVPDDQGEGCVVM